MSRRALRISLIVVAAVIVLVVGAGGVFLATFDPNTLKPRVGAAVKSATGRDIALNGRISLKPSLWPTVQAEDVALSNPPGFARPQMATLASLELQLSLLPLLRGQVAIDRLVLVKPDILLETNAQGQSNWQFTPAPGGAAQAANPSTSNGSASAISFQDVQIQDGTVTWRDDRKNAVTTIALKQFEAKTSGADAPLNLSAEATYNGVPVTISGNVGPLAQLQNPSNTPWPVKLTVTAGSSKLAVDGSLTQPMQGKGYNLAIDGNIADLAALAPLLPGVQLPPLHDLRVTTKVADSGGPIPKVSALTLHLGASDLNAYANGLRVTTVDITAPQLDQPVHIAAQATLQNMPLALTATVGAPAALLSGKPAAATSIDLSLQAAQSNLTLKGALSKPEVLAGADLALTANIPDLAALSPLAGRPLPDVKQIALQAKLADAPGGFARGAVLRDIKLTMPQADLAGDVTLVIGPPHSLTGKLHANNIDADALLAAAGKPVASAPNSNAGAPAAKPAAARAGRLFPDTPIPFGLLRQANADLDISVGTLKSGGSQYRNIDARAVVQGGKLRLDPFVADLPEGRFTATLTADATQPTPPVAITLRAPGLAVAPLLAAAGLRGYASGRLEVYADLRGAGTSPHAIASDLDGSLGLAIQGGTIDAPLLNSLLGPVLQQANLLSSLTHAGNGELRCFALRADPKNGVAEVRTLVLDSSIVQMDGSGSVNLRDETLALRLRPQESVIGAGVVVPLRVTGNLRSPSVSVDALGTATSNVGTVAGAVVSNATPLGLIGGALTGGKLFGKASGESCAEPLALARMQATPARTATGSAPARAQAAQPKSNNPANMLRQLFH